MANAEIENLRKRIPELFTGISEDLKRLKELEERREKEVTNIGKVLLMM